MTRPEAVLFFEGDAADILRVPNRSGRVDYPVTRRASLKDVVEALGVPHTEVHGLEVDGRAADFGQVLGPGQEVRVFGPVAPVDLSRPAALRPALGSAAACPSAPAFIVDENVGRLAMLLRLAGFDAAYDRAWGDSLIAETAQAQGRLVLTRDRALLKRSCIVHGRLVRSQEPREQLREVLGLFGLAPGPARFTRCLRCNMPLEPVDKDVILDRLEPKTRLYHHVFHRCPGCDRIYWPGSHHGYMAAFLEGLDLEAKPGPPR